MDFNKTYCGVPTAGLEVHDIPDSALVREVIAIAQIDYELARREARDHGAVDRSSFAARHGFLLGSGELMPLIDEVRRRGEKGPSICNDFMGLVDGLMQNNFPQTQASYMTAIYQGSWGTEAVLQKFNIRPEGYAPPAPIGVTARARHASLEI